MAYPQCPKCAHKPLPADQSFPAACPGCGVILAKIGVAPPTRPVAVASEDDEAADSLLARLFAPLTYVPDQVLRTYWTLRVAGLALLVLGSGWLVLRYDVRTGDGAVYLLWAFLMPFHEVGHIVFRPFGEFMVNLGGTLGQHALPIGLGALFVYRQRDPYAGSLMLALLGYSILEMATYMYDAQVPQLTLLTGRTGDTGGHDWIDLFGDMGLLDRAQAIGRAWGLVGRAVLVAACAWCAWIVVRQSAHLSDSAFAED